MRIAFGSVVYEAAYKFHNDFIGSINNQDTQKFDVLLLNDDLDDKKYEALVDSIERNVVRIKGKENLTISENRIELIKSAKIEKYDLLIFGDFDDVISKNRISEFVSNYDSSYSFFYNELYYLKTEKKFFRSLPAVIDDINPILECNFLGLSNTALNLNMIDFDTLEILIKKQAVAFDWIIYSFLLLKGHIGKRIDECKTFYRIYDQNTAGEIDISIEGLKKEIEIKKNHYENLIDTDSRYIELNEFYIRLYNSFGELGTQLLDKSKINNCYWWGRLNMNCILKEIL